MNKQEFLKKITKHQDVLQKYGIQSLSIFGPWAANDVEEKNSINVLVSLDSSRESFELEAAKKDLEKLLGVSVDLLTKHALPVSLKEKILHEAVLVF
jgi:predicted nucleotidyltransferase